MPSRTNLSSVDGTDTRVVAFLKGFIRDLGSSEQEKDAARRQRLFSSICDHHRECRLVEEGNPPFAVKLQRMGHPDSIRASRIQYGRPGFNMGYPVAAQLALVGLDC